MIITTPKIIFKILRLFDIKLPNVLANIDRIKNTIVNPSTKPIELRTVFFIDLFSCPAKYDIYIGSIGSKQGEINDATPSKNVNI